MFALKQPSKQGPTGTDVSPQGWAAWSGCGAGVQAPCGGGQSPVHHRGETPSSCQHSSGPKVHSAPQPVGMRGLPRAALLLLQPMWENAPAVGAVLTGHPPAEWLGALAVAKSPLFFSLSWESSGDKGSLPISLSPTASGHGPCRAVGWGNKVSITHPVQPAGTRPPWQQVAQLQWGCSAICQGFGPSGAAWVLPRCCSIPVQCCPGP